MNNIKDTNKMLQLDVFVFFALSKTSSIIFTMVEMGKRQVSIKAVV